jgi:lipopolysaccharide/colanic/teichoic acid biosynthesis glycosyltransferase
MSIIGPRPLLVEYLPWYTQTEKRRHSVRPGLTGWAQVNGRNSVNWDDRFKLDVEYVDNISLKMDIKILFMTVGKVFRREDTVRDGTASDVDFGDWLLQRGEVTEEIYQVRQKEAKELMKV